MFQQITILTTKKMKKYLGKEFADLSEREKFLRDNADGMENIGYAKDIPSEAVEKLKEKLAQATIKKMAVEAIRKEAEDILIIEA